MALGFYEQLFITVIDKLLIGLLIVGAGFLLNNLKAKRTLNLRNSNKNKPGT